MPFLFGVARFLIALNETEIENLRTQS